MISFVWFVWIQVSSIFLFSFYIICLSFFAFSYGLFVCLLVLFVCLVWKSVSLCLFICLVNMHICMFHYIYIYIYVLHCKNCNFIIVNTFAFHCTCILQYHKIFFIIKTFNNCVLLLDMWVQTCLMCTKNLVTPKASTIQDWFMILRKMHLKFCCLITTHKIMFSLRKYVFLFK